MGVWSVFERAPDVVTEFVVVAVALAKIVIVVVLAVAVVILSESAIVEVLLQSSLLDTTAFTYCSLFSCGSSCFLRDVVSLRRLMLVER